MWLSVLTVNLSFFFLGINGMLGGVNLLEIANTFAVDTYWIGYMITLMSLGSAISIFCTGIFVERVSSKMMLLLAAILMAASYIAITTAHSLAILGAAMFLCGTGAGIFLFIANHMIVNAYTGHKRTLHLNLINFSYSAGAVITPALAGQLLLRQVPWESIYHYSMIVVGVVFCLAWGIANNKAARQKKEVQVQEAWNLNVYLIASVFVFYALAEFIFSNWIVVYLREVIKADVAAAGLTLSIFWLFIMLGRFAAGFVVSRIKIEWFLLCSALLAFLAYEGILLAGDITSIMILTALTGLCFSGQYASFVSYGTMQVTVPSAKLINFYLTVSSIGGIISYLLAGVFKQYLGVYASLQVSAAAMGMIAILIGLTVINTKKKAVNKQAANVERNG